MADAVGGRAGYGGGDEGGERDQLCEMHVGKVWVFMFGYMRDCFAEGFLSKLRVRLTLRECGRQSKAKFCLRVVQGKKERGSWTEAASDDDA